jgi:hypothetical protein
VGDEGVEGGKEGGGGGGGGGRPSAQVPSQKMRIHRGPGHSFEDTGFIYRIWSVKAPIFKLLFIILFKMGQFYFNDTTTFSKIHKKENFKNIINVIIYSCLLSKHSAKEESS